MSQKELLKCRIEEERKKLNLLVAQGSDAKVYAQSLLLDRLIEQYMELAKKIVQKRKNLFCIFFFNTYRKKLNTILK